jgi:hypothetical protein
MLQIDNKYGLLISNYYFGALAAGRKQDVFVKLQFFILLNMPVHLHFLRSFLLVMSLLFLISGYVRAQLEIEHVRQVDTIETTLDLFGEKAPMHITLTFNIKEYQREKYKGEYMPVHFTYKLNDTVQLEKDMRLKARGKFRRNHCSLAPFWLDVVKTDQKNGNSTGFHRVKIVTHCKGAVAYAEYVLKEYLCYKIYNIISPVSFRVRLVRMTYVDTGRKNKATEGWAFMIEPEELLAQRMDAHVVRRDNISTALLRPWEIDILALFQYMIGNVDYSIYGRQNIKLLGLPGYGSAGYTPVPYDFDYTGLVDTYYAIPSEFTGLNSVRDRMYLGPCRDDNSYLAATKHLDQCRDEILDLIRNFEYLEERYKDEMIDYIEAYYAISENKKALLSAMKRTCI